MSEPAFTDLVDLAAERLGGAVLLANDEFFAPKESLLKAAAPVWKEDAYTDRGKWMDGWETRRRRSPGHDWCIVRLGLPGVIHGVIVDTAFFRGNFPESCSIEAATVLGTPTPEQLADGRRTKWKDILDRSPLRGVLWLEVSWLIFPLPILMIIFYWGADVFFQQQRAPADAMEVAVIGKQWMWKFQHPSGRREIDDARLEVGDRHGGAAQERHHGVEVGVRCRARRDRERQDAVPRRPKDEPVGHRPPHGWRV